MIYAVSVDLKESLKKLQLTTNILVNYTKKIFEK